MVWSAECGAVETGFKNLVLFQFFDKKKLRKLSVQILACYVFLGKH